MEVYKAHYLYSSSSRLASLNTFIPPENVDWYPRSGTLSPYFEKMHFTLDIKVSGTYSRKNPLYNVSASPGAKLLSVSYKYVSSPARGEDEDLFPDATKDELMSLAYARPSITFSSIHAQFQKTYQAPSGGGQYFTVRDLLGIVCKFEAEDRLLYDWLGGIDVHHIFYAGTFQNPDGSWGLCWDS
jgi:hypothetical protein